MANYRVTAPYVLLKVRDQQGKPAVNGFHAGAILPSSVAEMDPDNLKRHVDRGWVEQLAELIAEPADAQAEEAGDDAEPSADEASGGQGPESGDGAEQPGPARPSQADSKAAWVDYATTQGLDREQAESMTKADLIELLK